MDSFKEGNWNTMQWRPLREGMKQITLSMDAKDCTVTISQVVAGHAKRPHSHPEEQLALVISGECDYYVNGIAHHLTAGGFVVVPPNVEHYIDVHDTDEVCYQMDIFGTPRLEFNKAYQDFLNSCSKAG